MASSLGKGWCGHDTANGRRACRKAFLLALVVIFLSALLALAFLGYQQPELLLEYVNLRYCG